MAKRIYAPGELDKIKRRLGNISEKEAKRMQKVLGGEIGYERGAAYEAGHAPAIRKSGLPASGLPGPDTKPKRLVETAPADQEVVGGGGITGIPKFQRLGDPSYRERVKMDICAGSGEFAIKTLWQVFVSRLSFFNQPPDRVSAWFVKTNLNDYYARLECLVTSTRLLFPRNNVELGRKLQSESPTAFRILNTIRQWKLDVISSEINKVQSRPRSVFVKDFETMLREIYKPIFILQKLDIDTDIKNAYDRLYQIRFIENPVNTTEALQSKIPEALLALKYVCSNLHHLMYPLLMKIIALYYQEYESFFIENFESYKLFLGVDESNQILPDVNKTKAAKKDSGLAESAETEAEAEAEKDGEAEVYDMLSEEEREERLKEQALSEAEAKAFGRGLKLLETLFPKAPWDKLDTFADFYPYFSDVLEIKKNGELIAPEDPAHLALILSQVIEELLYGFRHINFEGVPFSDSLNAIVDDWHSAILESFEKKYLPLIYEYAHYFEHSSQKMNSTYALNIASEIHWIRRYYFLPSYEYTPVTPPSFAKKDVVALYVTARRLRKDLTGCAAAIEAANMEGGATTLAQVDGIKNPWEHYDFQVENPLSKRLDMLLGKKQRNNAALIFFTLAAATVLDSYLSGKNSAVYRMDNSILFRHTEQDKMKPVFWIEKQTGTFDLFKKSIEELRRRK
jgi:hypothetical protein